MHKIAVFLTQKMLKVAARCILTILAAVSGVIQSYASMFKHA
jgi:hypothetical protein